jgi:hypothetical protein
LYLFAWSSVRIARILVRVCSCSSAALRRLGSSSFLFSANSFSKSGTGRLEDTLKLLPLLSAEFEEIVKLLIYLLWRVLGGICACTPPRLVSIVNQGTNQKAKKKNRQDE